MASTLQRFYENKNIFITGGTGFIGITLVEKLLRTFPDVGSIYLLVRPKRGISFEERRKNYFNNIVFDRLKSEQNIEIFSNKLHWIEGNIYEKNLGISKENLRRLQNEINLIIHGAAELDFRLPMKSYVEANVRATYDLLKIAEGSSKLCGFVYISSIYGQLRGTLKHTTETVVKTKLSPIELMKMAETMSVEEMQSHVKSFNEDWLSYYAYSKTSAENACLLFEGRFPIAIFRPGMVGHTYAEPKPHYIGNNLGFPRILFEANRGFVLCCEPEVTVNNIPADITSNSILAVLWKTSQDCIMDVKVYNSTNNNNTCTTSDAYRYYANSIPDYETVLVPHRYRLMEMNNAPPGSLEEKMQKKIKIFEIFYSVYKLTCSLSQLTFDSNNLDVILGQMTDEEKALLSFDIRTCDWRKYYSDMVANQHGLPKFPEFEDLIADPGKRADARNLFLDKIKSKI